MSVILGGLASRSYPQLFPPVLGKYPGDVLWAVMIFLGVGLVLPSRRTGLVAAVSLGICFAVEVAKLSPNGWLAELRQTAVGHLMLGRVFMWQNFVAYTLGIAMATIGELIGRRQTPAHAAPRLR